MSINVEQVRRNNFKVVVETLGGATAVAKKLKLSGPSWISQLINGDRAFTEKTARKYELRLALQRGSLDIDKYLDPSTPPVIANRDAALFTECRQLIISQLAERREDLSNERFGALMEVVVVQAMKTGKADPELVDQLLTLIGKDPME